MENNSDFELVPEDLTYFKDEKTGGIKAGGYSINSTLLSSNTSPIIKGGKKRTLDTTNISNLENKVSDKFNNMVIPAGLLYLHQSLPHTSYGPIEVCEMDDVIPEDLYSRLVALSEVKEKEKQKKLTRNKRNKVAVKKGRKTKKQSIH